MKFSTYTSLAASYERVANSTNPVIVAHATRLLEVNASFYAVVL